MDKPIHVLIVEDSEDDTLLIVHELRHKGFDVIYERIDTLETMEAALERRHWDVVLSDHSMPHFSSFHALELMKKKGLDLPFIIVSGSIGEEMAVAAMKAGVHDYIMKDNLMRLVPAIERELKEAALRRERKRAEEELRLKSEIISNMTEGVCLIRARDGVIVYTNPTFEKMFGYDARELIGKHASIVNASGEKSPEPGAQEIISALNKDGIWEGEVYNIKKGGTSFWSYASISAFEHHEYGLVWIAVHQDITKLKRAEEEKRRMQAQLIQAQKMESIGTLAGGVAHDFSNILTTILGNAQWGMKSLKEGDPLYENLKEIQQASRQAANLTRQLLLFSRKQPMEVHSLSLNDTVNNLMKMLKRLIGEDIAVHTTLNPDLWTVTADPGSVEQVIMNIVINAKDAMPEGGSIKIKTENTEIDKDYCEIYKYAHPGRFVFLSVEDTGIGMDKGVMEHIFEPFFTTKGLGKGTGLGLSVVYGIVKQHEGWINVSSEPGKGSTFEVYLPASSGMAEDVIKKEVISGQDIQGKGKKILLVEDDPGIRELAKNVLITSGYEVLEASSTQEALDISEKEKEDLAIVFSDVVLPDKSGLQLAEELLLRKPTLKVLLTSGYTDQKSQWPVIREKGYQFIQKPYDITDLLCTIRRTINEGNE